MQKVDTIVNDLWKFRRFSKNETRLGLYDTPGNYYFKLLFDFSNDNGLLGGYEYMLNNDKGPDNLPSSEKGDAFYTNTYHDNAYDFLMINDEWERADICKNFVKLLSDINRDFPWYWQSISGLDSILERKMFDKEFKIEEEDPKITIKCLPDAADNRIGVLLDSYRAISYSYTHKREILPSNLRKFDMAIYIIHTPIANESNIHTGGLYCEGDCVWNGYKDEFRQLKSWNEKMSHNEITSPNVEDRYIGFADDTSKTYLSSKLIELRNCEFVMNSSKSAYSDLNNAEGFQQEYSIEISVGDAYESRFDTINGINIGDYITTDLYTKVSDNGRGGNKGDNITIFTNSKTKEKDNINWGKKSVITPPNKLMNKLSKMTDDAMNAVQGMALAPLAAAKSTLKSTVNKYLLGNIYKVNVANITDQVKSITSNATRSLINGQLKKNTGGDDHMDKLPGTQTTTEKVTTIKTGLNSEELKGSKLPNTPTFEEKKANLLRKINTSQNIFNSI